MFLNEFFKNTEISRLRQFVNKAPNNVINMGLGEIRFKMNSELIDYAKEILENELITYTPNAGFESLKNLIKKQYEYNANVCVTCGAEEAVFALLFATLKKGDEVLVPNPSYPAYETIIKMCGAVPKFFNLEPKNDFAIDRSSFENAITSKTKMIIFSYPSNPLGTVFSFDEIKFILEISKKNNLLIAVDEIYRELYLQKRIESFYEDSKNIVVISGISKAFAMSGWRLGWLVSSNKKLIDGITVAHQYIATCAPYLSQKLAIKLLSEKDRYIKYYRQKLLKSLSTFIDILKSEIANFRTLDFKAAPYLFVSFGYDDLQFSEKLLENGLLSIPGSFFGTNGSKWIRFNYAINEKKLIKAAEIVVDTSKYFKEKYLQ